jgi:hypothetical protein
LENKKERENSANSGVDKRTALKQTIERRTGTVWVWFGAETGGEHWQTKE